MRVEARCQAGLHQWWFDRAGEFVGGAMAVRLFELPEPEHKPRNAIDN